MLCFIRIFLRYPNDGREYDQNILNKILFTKVHLWVIYVYYKLMHGYGSFKKKQRNPFTHLDYRKSLGCIAASGAFINGVIFLNIIVKAYFENEKFRTFGYLRRRATVIYIHFNDPNVKRFVITSALTRRKILHV